MHDCLNYKHRDIFIQHWDINSTLSTVADDDKHHVGMIVASNDLKKAHIARNSLNSMECHTVALNSINFSLSVEYERANDTTSIVALRLIDFFYHVKLQLF